jgi:hypothetical protein
MLTVTCKLTFSDGKEVAGKMEARSAGENYPITYTGRVDRLRVKYAQGTYAAERPHLVSRAGL